jgi:hypothetical protein
MAQVTVVNPHYVEHEHNFFIQNALTKLDTIQKGLCFTFTDVKQGRFDVPTIDGTVQINPRALFPVDSGAFTISDRTIFTGQTEVKFNIDPDQFITSWHFDQVTALLRERKIPVTFENWLGTYFTQKVYTFYERMMWMGSKTYTASKGTINAPGVNWNIQYIDGYIKDALTSSALQVASPSTVTDVNIVSKLESLKALIPDAVFDAGLDKLKFLVSIADIRLYTRATQNASFKGQNFFDRGKYMYDGFEIDTCAGLPKDTMLFGHFDNAIESQLYLAMPSFDNFSIEINKLQADSRAHFYKHENEFGVRIARPTEMAIHTPLTLASFNA